MLLRLIDRLEIHWFVEPSVQANQRVEEFKIQLKSLKVRLNETEKRALFAEKSVKSYLAELDMREGNKGSRGRKKPRKREGRGYQ